MLRVFTEFAYAFQCEQGNINFIETGITLSIFIFVIIRKEENGDNDDKGDNSCFKAIYEDTMVKKIDYVCECKTRIISDIEIMPPS